MRARWLALGFAMGALLSPLRAAAEPTLWQRVREPKAREEARVLAGLERLLDAREQVGDDRELAERLARAAVALAELAKLGRPSEPRLACALAVALIGANVGRVAEAAELLESAIPQIPPSELLAHAWHELGIARSLQGEHRAARDAETRVLELTWDTDARATAFYNRAEEEMQLGALDRAERDYRAATREAPGSEIQALARFGLGVVLERTGDLPGAFTALEQGLRIRLPLSRYASDDPLDLPGVFFVPAYERFYLGALLAMVRARQAEDASGARSAYERAVSEWDAYLLAAEQREPWLENARRHRERCAAELRKLPARRARRPRATP